MSYHRNIAYWEEHGEWFDDAVVHKDYFKSGEYATSNPVFKNKMIWYRIMRSRLEYALRAYQTESKKLFEEIQSHLNNYK